MPNPKRRKDRLKSSESASPFYLHGEELKKALTSAGNPLALLEMAHDAIIVRDISSVVQFWNRGATDLYEWTSEEAVGSVIHGLLDTKFSISKEDIDWSLLNVGHWEGDLNHRRKDGSRITVASRQALRRDEDGKPVFILEINRDITNSAYLKLLQEVAVGASESSSIDAALHACLRSICVYTGWCVGRACIVSTGEAGGVESRSLWYASETGRFTLFQEFCEKDPRSLETGLAGRVLRSSAPVWINDIGKDEHLARAPRDARIHSAFGFPIVAGGTVVAVLELFSETPMDMDVPLLEVLANVGRQLGRVFERVTAEEAQRRLSLSLMRSQDEERRRIARELHDSGSQYLAGAKMCVDEVRRQSPNLPPNAKSRLEEAGELIESCLAEIRTLSYLLHPPLLEQMGLGPATRWYVEGFASRGRMKVDLEIPGDLPRLDEAIELCLFRVLQECLTNVHRHSGSKAAKVKIAVSAQAASVEVRDQGKGIPKRASSNLQGHPRPGVGIRGMRERLSDLGGILQIASDEHGTTVKAAIPLKLES